MDISAFYDGLQPTLYPSDTLEENPQLAWDEDLRIAWDVGQDFDSFQLSNHLVVDQRQSEPEEESPTAPSTPRTPAKSNEFIIWEGPGSKPGDAQTSKDADKHSSSAMAQRRRAQNRASQKKFRERKEQHTKSLVRQLEALTIRYNALRESYSRNHTTELELQSQVAELNTALVNLRRRINTSATTERSEAWHNFTTFDGVVPASESFAWNLPNSQLPMTHFSQLCIQEPPSLEVVDNLDFPDFDDLLGPS